MGAQGSTVHAAHRLVHHCVPPASPLNATITVAQYYVRRMRVLRRCFSYSYRCGNAALWFIVIKAEIIIAKTKDVLYLRVQMHLS